MVNVAPSLASSGAGRRFFKNDRSFDILQALKRSRSTRSRLGTFRTQRREPLGIPARLTTTDHAPFVAGMPESDCRTRHSHAQTMASYGRTGCRAEFCSSIPRYLVMSSVQKL